MIVYTQNSLKIHQLPDGPLQTNAYWIDTGAVSCLVDPILHPQNQPSQASPLILTLATHGHFDHIGQCDSWRTLKKVQLAIHQAEESALTDPTVNHSSLFRAGLTYKPADILLSDEQIVTLDASVSLRVIHTPGHTPGGICLLVLLQGKPQALLTGDTLFAGSVGRVDLGGDEAQLMASLKHLIDLFGKTNPDLLVLPGHGPQTTIQAELASNPYLRRLH